MSATLWTLKYKLLNHHQQQERNSSFEITINNLYAKHNYCYRNVQFVCIWLSWSFSVLSKTRCVSFRMFHFQNAIDSPLRHTFKYWHTNTHYLQRMNEWSGNKNTHCCICTSSHWLTFTYRSISTICNPMHAYWFNDTKSIRKYHIKISLCFLFCSCARARSPSLRFGASISHTVHEHSHSFCEY